MITLYAAKGTGSVAPQAVLAYAQAEHDIYWIDYAAGEHHADDFLAINPRGQIPALRLADGTVVTESAAIVLHLADCYPGAGLIDKPASVQRAITLRWIIFMATNIYEDFLRMEYPANYTNDTAAQASVSASGAESMDRSWSIVNTGLSASPHLSGAGLSIADIYMAMLLSWHPQLAALDSRYPNLLPAARHTLSFPQIHKVFEENESLI